MAFDKTMLRYFCLLLLGLGPFTSAGTGLGDWRQTQRQEGTKAALSEVRAGRAPLLDPSVFDADVERDGAEPPGSPDSSSSHRWDVRAADNSMAGTLEARSWPFLYNSVQGNPNDMETAWEATSSGQTKVHRDEVMDSRQKRSAVRESKDSVKIRKSNVLIDGLSLPYYVSLQPSSTMVSTIEESAYLSPTWYQRDRTFAKYTFQTPGGGAAEPTDNEWLQWFQGDVGLSTSQPLSGSGHNSENEGVAPRAPGDAPDADSRTETSSRTPGMPPEWLRGKGKVTTELRRPGSPDRNERNESTGEDAVGAGDSTQHTPNAHAGDDDGSAEAMSSGEDEVKEVAADLGVSTAEVREVLTKSALATSTDAAMGVGDDGSEGSGG